MSIKTIAVDSRVYERLARLKQESESFSRLINRLLDQVTTANTGAQILANLESAPHPLSDAEARAMAQIIDVNRSGEAWESHDLH